MKNILTQEQINHIKKMCDTYDIQHYSINNDGSIDVNGMVRLSGGSFTKFPLTFNIVAGHFIFIECGLTSLEGCPREVGGDFIGNYNKIENLRDSPRVVKGTFQMMSNKLTSIEGCPNEIGGNFICSGNEISSFKGGENLTVKQLSFYNNQIETLEFCPTIMETYTLFGNKLPTLIDSKLLTFTPNSTDVSNLNVFVKYQSYYDVWADGFNEDNFNELMDEIKDGLR